MSEEAVSEANDLGNDGVATKENSETISELALEDGPSSSLQGEMDKEPASEESQKNEPPGGTGNMTETPSEVVSASSMVNAGEDKAAEEQGQAMEVDDENQKEQSASTSQIPEATESTLTSLADQATNVSDTDVEMRDRCDETIQIPEFQKESETGEDTQRSQTEQMDDNVNEDNAPSNQESDNQECNTSQSEIHGPIDEKQEKDNSSQEMVEPISERSDGLEESEKPDSHSGKKDEETDLSKETEKDSSGLSELQAHDQAMESKEDQSPELSTEENKQDKSMDACELENAQRPLTQSSEATSQSSKNNEAIQAPSDPVQEKNDQSEKEVKDSSIEKPPENSTAMSNAGEIRPKENTEEGKEEVKEPYDENKTPAKDSLSTPNPQSEAKNQTEANKDSDDDDIIEISAIGSKPLTNSDIAKEDDDLQITVVRSATENELKQKEDKDPAGMTDAQESQEDKSKKPMLKLASFAGLGSNGITDDTPVSAMGSVPMCSQCSKPNFSTFAQVVWETMQFCNEECLAKYQEKLTNCASCKKTVHAASLGKYCVRFGSMVRQFCSSSCLETYKKGLKVCCFCQKDLSGSEGFLAPIGDKGQFKDFCEQECLKKYEILYLKKQEEKKAAKCEVCQIEKTIEITFARPEIKEKVKLCSMPCFSAYKFSNSVDSLECSQCNQKFDLKLDKNVVYYNGKSEHFCSEACSNVYVMLNRKIISCAWCKVKKYNFDMIEQWTSEKECLNVCSINCLKLYKNVSKKGPSTTPSLSTGNVGMPVIQSVSSLATSGEAPSQPDRLPVTANQNQQQVQTIREVVKDVIVHKPQRPPMRNKGTLTKPYVQTKGVSCRPHPCHKSTQTDAPAVPALFPIVTPMYMPLPLHMYNAPFPVPVPVPIPVPVPVFIPTTRNSAKGILKQIKKIQANLPTDPFEADLLAMAGALVDRKESNSGFESDDSLEQNESTLEQVMNEALNDHDAIAMQYQQGQDLTARQQQERNGVDFESEVEGGRVMPKALPSTRPDQDVSPGPEGSRQFPAKSGATKRRRSQSRDDDSPWAPDGVAKNGRRSSSRMRNGRASKQPRNEQNINSNLTARDPKDRPDAKNHLKYTYGVNAWKHWVIQKNIELEKARAEGKYMKPFETDILKLRADELNYTLCLFVKEVKKPNGEPYAPDSVFYLSLGIQEYLFENGRIDNIFTDVYYEAFTSALHEVVNDFKLPVNELGYFVTRIEEEHLWEAKQLGAHSPQVLLNTLIYFNTKYFMLKDLEQHKKLSFSHIMKHWKKPANAQSNANSRPNQLQNQTKSVLLRYYPPAQKGKAFGGREERKCYEQHENTENPLRCPVKLYEFYLSKCPDITKTRNDMFYLQPERSCVPESPVWYSASPLNSHQLDKMLQRLLMVREVQEHMLADGGGSS